MWVHPILMARQVLGEYRLVRELHFHTDHFQMYIRLTKEQFESLLSRVGQPGKNTDKLQAASLP